MEGDSIHCTQCSGAPAATAASRTMRAAAVLHTCAEGWKANTTGLRVFSASSALKRVVDVGLVTGVTAQSTPTGSAISMMPSMSSRRTTPAVLARDMLWVTCSQANMFLAALSSKTPRPVSSTARRARAVCWSRAATDALATMWSTMSCVKDSKSASALEALSTRRSTAMRVSDGAVSGVGLGVLVCRVMEAPWVWMALRAYGADHRGGHAGGHPFRAAAHSLARDAPLGGGPEGPWSGPDGLRPLRRGPNGPAPGS